jgi:GDP-L-fucose synthase
VNSIHINIGTGEDLEIKELAKKIAKASGFTGEIIWDSTRPDGTPRKVLDVSRISKLGWNPSITLEQGISQTVEYFLNLKF